MLCYHFNSKVVTRLFTALFSYIGYIHKLTAYTYVILYGYACYIILHHTALSQLTVLSYHEDQFGVVQRVSL